MYQIYRFFDMFHILKSLKFFQVILPGSYYIISCYKHFGTYVLFKNVNISIITQWHADAIALGVQQASYLC